MDGYDLQARHAPVVFTLLPIIFTVMAVVPEFGHAKFQAGTMGSIVVVALAFVATRFARAAGRRRQNALFALWKGQPTTTVIRGLPQEDLPACARHLHL
jgi:hypothetical protein